MLAVALPALLACVDGSATGPLVKIEIEHGDSIKIRALLSGSVVTGISPLFETAIELAIEDFGPVRGYPFSFRTLDEKYAGEGARGGRDAASRVRHSIGNPATLPRTP